MTAVEVPVVDLGSADVVTSLASAYETVGFAQLVGHGVPRDLITAVFEASARFHELSLEEKLAIELDRHHRGYIAIDTSTDRRSELGPASEPNQSASFMMMREAGPDDPDVLAGHYLAGPNQWPAIDGFRDVLEQYAATMEQLGRTVLDHFMTALGTTVPDGALDPPTSWLRLLHYPARPGRPGSFGSAPHVDFGAITLLAQDTVGGLQVQGPDRGWLDVPPIDDALVLNTGSVMRHWSNGRFKATPHRVVNDPQRERFSVAYFLDPHVATVVDGLDGPWTDAPYVFGDFLRAELETGYDRHARSSRPPRSANT